MIEDESEDLRIAVCTNNCRSADQLLPVIERWVEKGSVIRTDCWKAYDRLPSLNYVHQQVNHSATFVTEEGVHTNRIESSWRPLKDRFRKIHIRSVCEGCQKKFNDAAVEAQEDVEKRKELYAKIRQERGSCAGCEEHENAFLERIVEYLWRRENRKYGIDPFERLLDSIRTNYATTMPT
jgi:hypothetical protein